MGRNLKFYPITELLKKIHQQAIYYTWNKTGNLVTTIAKFQIAIMYKLRPQGYLTCSYTTTHFLVTFHHFVLCTPFSPIFVSFLCFFFFVSSLNIYSARSSGAWKCLDCLGLMSVDWFRADSLMGRLWATNKRVY